MESWPSGRWHLPTKQTYRQLYREFESHALRHTLNNNMLTLNNIISEEEIELFKQYFQTNLDKKYINWQVGDTIIDHRLTIDKTSSEFEIVCRIVANNFSDTVDVWSAYQRQTNPHGIHIDDYGDDQPDLFRYTYILAMDTEPKFKTFVWKEKCWDNDALHAYVTEWGKLRRLKKKLSNISEIQDLEHTIDENQKSYIADYLTLDGVYPYKKGTGVLFDATQLHCTSNWKKYNEFPHRELLQIHVLCKHEQNF